MMINKQLETIKEIENHSAYLPSGKYLILHLSDEIFNVDFIANHTPIGTFLITSSNKPSKDPTYRIIIRLNNERAKELNKQLTVSQSFIVNQSGEIETPRLCLVKDRKNTIHNITFFKQKETSYKKLEDFINSLKEKLSNENFELRCPSKLDIALRQYFTECKLAAQVTLNFKALIQNINDHQEYLNRIQQPEYNFLLRNSGSFSGALVLVYNESSNLRCMPVLDGKNNLSFILLDDEQILKKIKQQIENLEVQSKNAGNKIDGIFVRNNIIPPDLEVKKYSAETIKKLFLKLSSNITSVPTSFQPQ